MENFPQQLAYRFRPQRLLGAGAMGRVYLATDLELDRDVALKLLLDAGHPGLRERFWREVESLAKVRHPNVMQVFDWGLAGDDPYLVIEYLEGRSLEQGRVRDPERVTLELAAALDEVHRVGLVHRDLKPANVMRCRDGRVVLTDFGLVRDLERANLTATGQIVGSLGFLAPEVLRGTRGTAAADWFALGVTLFFLVEGRLPVTGAEVMAVARGTPYPEPHFEKVAPGGRLATLVRALVREHPEDRAGSRRALEGLLAAAPAGGPTPGEAAPPRAATPAAEASPSEASQALPLDRSLAAAPHRVPRSRATAVGLLLAGLVALPLAWWRRAPPAAPPLTSPAPGAAAPSAAVLPEDYPARVRAELEAAGELMVRPEGTLAPLPIGSRPEGWLPLLDGDPVRFLLARRHLPELARFFAFRAAGGRAEELPRPFADELRHADAWYQRRGLLGPFGPYLDPPGEGPLEPCPLWLDPSWPPEVRAPTGWLAEAQRASRLAQEAVEGSQRELPGMDGRLVTTEPHVASTLAVHALGRDRPSLPTVTRELFRDPRTRRFVASWLRPGQAHLLRLLHAVARAADRGGAVGEAAARLAAVACRDLRVLFYGLPAYLPPEALLGPAPGTASGWAIRAAVLAARLEVQREAREGSPVEETAALYMEAWPPALEIDGATPARAAARLGDVLPWALRHLRRQGERRGIAEAWRRFGPRVRELDTPAEVIWLELLQAWNAGDLSLERPDLERMLQALSARGSPAAQLFDLATRGGFSRLQHQLGGGGGDG